MPSAGDLDGARDQCAALLAVNERVLGPEHPDTLATRGDLAYWSGEAGDAAGARDQYAALLAVNERVLGPEHPDTLATRGDLAYWSGEAGDAAGARDQYAALLPLHARVLGPEHPETLTTGSNLARWTGEAGDAAGARDQYAALLPLHARVLGPEHPETLTTGSNLARWTGEAGDAAAARDQLAALLPVREWVLGPEHPGTLTTRNNLAYWTGEAGDAAAARDQLAALLPVRERVLGPEHPGTLTTRNNLAYWTGEAGDAAAARDQYAALLPVRERVLGPEHPGTLTTRGDLAYWRSKGADLAASCVADVSRTIKCALLGDALVLGSMLEEHGAHVRRPDDDAPLTMVATGTLDGIRAAVAQLRHELVGAGPVLIEGEDRDYGAHNGQSAAPGGHIGEETPVADPARSQAIPRPRSASTAEGSQCKLPAEPGDQIRATHAEAMLPETGPAARGESPGSAERAGGAQAEAVGRGPATGALDAREWADPDQLLDFEVVIIPTEAGYHRSGCSLIRLLGSDDLETLTWLEAEADGYVPCRACKPDSPLWAQT